MLTKPIALVGLAAVMLAAGAGSYLAVRQNTTPLQQGVATENPTTIGPAEAIAPQTEAVAATEAVVEDREPAVAEGAAPARPASAEPAVPAAPPPPVEPMPARPDVARTPAPPNLGQVAPTDDRPASNATGTSTPDRSVVAPSDAPQSGTATTDSGAPPAAADNGVVASELEPAKNSPVERAAADLPSVEGWSRVEGRTPAESDAPPPVIAESPVDDRNLEVEPLPTLVQYEIAADSVIGLQVETAVSTRTAAVEDSVEARVTRDVLVADQVAVPAGTRMRGSVVLVEQSGKLRDASRLGVRFHTLVMDEGLEVPVVTETIYREGTPKGRDSVAKIGGAAVGGAILGAIFGGTRGAAIGGSIGAAGGTAAAINGEAEPAGLPPGTMLTVRLSRPAIVAVEQ